MAYIDSIDKIVQTYFNAVTSEEFTYKNKVYSPKPLQVSPLLFRGFTCPEHCAGCCPKFSLDYINPLYPKLEPRVIYFNRHKITIFSDMQETNKKNKCIHVNKVGRCNIHGMQPFSCDFELIRILLFKNKSVITQKLFGRGWAMMKIDGTRGALCTMTNPSKENIYEVKRKLLILQDWTNYFGIKTKIPKILEWIDEVTPFIPYRQIKSIIIK